MERNAQILLFGDQTGDFRTIFRQIFEIKNDPLLTSFLEQVYSALRDEVAQQPRSVRAQISGFTGLADLVARYYDYNESRSNALESALTCASQIAYFISYQGSTSREYPSAFKTRILGSCTGLIAAAAISSTSNLIELASIAVDAVRVAFRVGVLVSEVGDQIEQSSVTSPSWSTIIPGTDEQDVSSALNDFHRSMRIPPCSQVYISAISKNALTISGPRLVVDQLFQHSPTQGLKSIKLPIYGPYHAAHLYNSDDMEALLQPISSTSVHRIVPRIPLMSTSTKAWFSASTLGELMEGVLIDILMRPLYWDSALEVLVSTMKGSGASKCTVTSLGPSQAAQSIILALQEIENLEVTIDDFSLHDLAVSETAQASGKLDRSKIAICGLAGRFPDAADHEAFWKLLEKGLDLHREIPKDRFEISTHVDASGKTANTSHTPFGCFIEQPGLFDPRFFNISPREATMTDPMQRLALVTAYEALESSGFVSNRTPSTQLDRVGTFYGQTSDDWREIQASQKIDTYFIPGGVRAFGPGRINYHFNFSGPSFSIDTACSSSLAAIQLACTSLWAGDCDTAVAGGANVLTNPDIFSGLSRGQFLSKKGPCQTFDDEADGYCRADGVGTVILKRLEDAQADKDPILAVILGAATNHSAEAVSITHPHAGAQEFLYKKILNAANIDPHDVSYVEMHGTGTQAGDAIEMKSVTNVFAPASRQRRPDQKVHLGAVKANAGHAEAASGITSLIKILMMMKKSIIPPHCGIKGSINHTFPKDLEERNVHIAFKPTPWIRQPGMKRRVFLNNFSAAGGNTGLLLEDGISASSSAPQDPRSTHIVSVSAKSKYSLQQNLKDLTTFLDQNPAVDLPSLSYTTTARRAQHKHRTTVLGFDVKQVKDALTTSIGRDTPIPTSKPRAAFVFTGQGSFYTAMAKQLYDDSPLFRNEIKLLDSIGRIQGFPSIQPVIDGSLSESQLTPLIVQISTVCVQIALSKLWVAWGVHPTVVVGHSLGEYAALNIAGVLSVSETIYLVGQRARLLEEKCQTDSHAMLAIKASWAAIRPFLNGKAIEVACINAPEETVISGTRSDIDLMSECLKDRGLKSTKLPVPYAFHSSQVEPILDDYETAAKGITFRTPSIPVISPLLNTVVTDDRTFGPSYLRRHCRETVDFLGGLEASQHAGVVDDHFWIEIGSHPICSAMIKATLGQQVRTVASLRRTENNWKTIATSLCSLHSAGLDIDWSEYHRGFDPAHKLLHLPTYSWDNKNYWTDYTNDWCLTKGDPASKNAKLRPRKSRLSTTSVQWIVEENFEGDKARFVVESDLAEPDLKEAIMGHEVNGLGLCPPSLYADMALSIGDYLFRQLRPGTTQVDMNVCNMKVEKPLVANEEDSQMIRVAADADLSTNQVKLSYYSIDSEGKKTITHATCGIRYENADTWLDEWQRSNYLISTRVEQLKDGVHREENNLFKSGMAYKLFGGLIRYSAKYRGMKEVILNSAELEATSSVVFQASEKDGNFFRSPYWTDSVAHLSGFVMIANDTADPSKKVYVSHGWESYRVARPFSADKTYRAYVKMQPAGANVVLGNVYIFEADVIVAVVEGLKFHCIPRSLMDSLISKAGGTTRSTAGLASSLGSQKVDSRAKSVQQSKSKPTTAASPRKASADTIQQAINIMAEEIGIKATEMSDESLFVELGVDSLLSLSISGKFREMLGLEVASNFFDACPTLGDVKQYIAQNDGVAELLTESSLVATPSDTATPGTNTPDIGTDSQSSMSNTEQAMVNKYDSEDLDLIKTIRSTIASEMEVTLDEISDTTDLADLGMDSLMSLSILSNLREVTGKDLPSDLLTRNTTFEAIENGLGLQRRKSSPPKPKSKAVVDDNNLEAETENRPEANPSPPATSVLLQGTPEISTKTLFLFPDGSGSATSYTLVPNVAATTAIYGLNSPFLKCPELYTVSIPALATIFLSEIVRRQPNGPYNLGGWSAGGVIAYEACLQLRKKGSRVERLILLDAPCPTDLRPLPNTLHTWFDSMGLLGPTGNSRGTPDWLLPHFDASIAALSAYKPASIAAKFDAEDQKSPFQVWLLWARDGVCKYPEDPRPPEPEEYSVSAKWLLYERKDLGFQGWESLVGRGRIKGTDSVPGANHFTMMRKPNTVVVGEFIGRAME